MIQEDVAQVHVMPSDETFGHGADIEGWLAVARQLCFVQGQRTMFEASMRRSL